MSPTLRRRVARQKRATVLAFLGVIFFISGWVQHDTASVVAKSPIAQQSFHAHLRIAPLEAWSWWFMVMGAGAFVLAFIPKIRWAGFALLQMLSLFWGLLYIASYFETGYGRAWTGFLLWGAISGLLAIMADWDDPPKPPGVR